MGFGSSHSCCSLAVGCSFVVERCSFVDGQPVLELEQLERSAGSCSSELEPMDVRLELDVHHPGKLGCSIFHHKIRHRIGSTCRMDRRSRVVVELVDIVAEQAEGWAVVVLVVRLANDLRKLGI